MWPGSQVRLAPPPQCEQRSSGDLEARPSPGLGGDRSGATAWIRDLRASPLIKFGGSNEREEPAAHESPALNGQEDGGVPLMRQESWGGQPGGHGLWGERAHWPAPSGSVLVGLRPC